MFLTMTRALVLAVGGLAMIGSRLELGLDVFVDTALVSTMVYSASLSVRKVSSMFRMCCVISLFL